MLTNEGGRFSSQHIINPVSIFFFFGHSHFPASGQAVVTGVIPSPRFLPSIFIAQRVQQSHCSSIVHRVLLTHALALSASQFVHKKKSQRIYTSMHSAGLELTKLTYARLEVNLIRHRGDRTNYPSTEGTPLLHAPQKISVGHEPTVPNWYAVTPILYKNIFRTSCRNRCEFDEFRVSAHIF